MDFDLAAALPILERTPATLRILLDGLPSEWVRRNDGGETWSPFDVIGHLIHGERTDWILRARMILESGESRPFTPFDRFAQFRESEGKELPILLREFEELRAGNLQALRAMRLSNHELAKTGMHPDLGRVTLSELLATWVAHDLSHITQISRTMARQYRAAVGPWQAYLSLLA